MSTMLNKLKYFKENMFLNYHEFVNLNNHYYSTVYLNFEESLYKITYCKNSDQIVFKQNDSYICSKGNLKDTQYFEDEDELNETLEKEIIKHEHKKMCLQVIPTTTNKKKVNKI